MKSWRILIPVIALLIGCGTSQENDSLFDQALGGLRGSEFVPRFTALLKAEAPALQIGFVERQEGGTLLLERRDGDFDYWLSPDGVQIILQNGMLHGTRGLGEGLLASELSEPLSHVRGLTPGYSDRFHTYLDGNDQAETRTYRCLFTVGAQSEVALRSKTVQTVQMRENCRSLDQEFTNIYWVTPETRRIVQSRQWAGPFVGALSTRVVE